MVVLLVFVGGVVGALWDLGYEGDWLGLLLLPVATLA